MTSSCNLIANENYFFNIDETAVYLNCALNLIVNTNGLNTVSIVVGGSSSICLRLAVTFAMDGSELLLFFTFKDNPGGSIESALSSRLPVGIIRCAQ